MKRCWIHAGKRRYFCVHLQQDLFGDWTLLRDWGSLDHGHGQGRMLLDAVRDPATGQDLIAAIHKRRLAHGYRPVMDQ